MTKIEIEMANSNPFGDDGQRNYGSTAGRSSREDSVVADARFKKMREQIQRANQEIKQQNNELRELLDTIGTPNDDMRLRKRITCLRESAFKLVTDTSQLFMSFDGNTGQEIAVRALQRQFSLIADQFSRVYEDIVNKLQEHPRPVRYSLRESRGYTSSGELDVEGENVRLTRADVLEQEQDQEYVETEASYAENRVREMRELQDNMVALHEVMTSMQRMVVDQGEQVDGIESNVETAAVEVLQGNRQLSTAVKYKRCSRRLILIIVLVCVGITVGLIITIVIAVCATGGCKGK